MGKNSENSKIQDFWVIVPVPHWDINILHCAVLKENHSEPLLETWSLCTDTFKAVNCCFSKYS